MRSLSAFSRPAVDRPGALPIGAQQMGRVVLRDKPDLAGRRPPAVEHDLAFNARLLGEFTHQHTPGLILADHADEHAASPERNDVARNVAGATDHGLVPLHRDHRRRRLRRDARDAAIVELIKHEIADAEHRLIGEFCEVLIKAMRGRGHCDSPGVVSAQQ